MIAQKMGSELSIYTLPVVLLVRYLVHW